MVGTYQEIISWLFKQDRNKLFEIKIKRPKRSLTQNGYAWVLINEIANVLRLSKEEVYLAMLKEYGQRTFAIVEKNVNLEGFAKYYEKIDETSKSDSYIIYKGSSKYDSKEMSIFIDGIIQECKQLEIETLPKDEIERLEL